MKTRRLDHIDLRVHSRAIAQKFYEQILPELGFTLEKSDAEFGTFYAQGEGAPMEFFGFTEDPNHRANGTRIAFWAEKRAEVDRLAEIVKKAGGLNLEGPELCVEYTPGYYSFFFEDPSGNKLEICSRQGPVG
jgi:catechol 2,3-dioxygenase-like lactoylglutathione lyase family enzyme